MASSTGNGAASTLATPRPDGDPVTAAVVKVEPGAEGNSAETSGSSSANCSTAGPASTLTPVSKDIKGNSSSALHWLADLATQKAKDDSKGELLCVICMTKSAETSLKVWLCLWDIFMHLCRASCHFYIMLNKLNIAQILLVTSLFITLGLSFKTLAPSGP